MYNVLCTTCISSKQSSRPSRVFKTGSRADAVVPTAAAGLSAMADIQVTLVKTPEGVGMNIAADGTVLSYTSSGGPAEAAGIPLKSKIVTVNGSPSLPA